MRWAGPFRLGRDSWPAPLHPNEPNLVHLPVTGDSDTADCEAEWRLLAPTRDRVVAQGAGRVCDRLLLRLPPALPLGPYLLEITALAVDGNRREISDALTTKLTVIEPRAGPR